MALVEAGSVALVLHCEYLVEMEAAQTGSSVAGPVEKGRPRLSLNFELDWLKFRFLILDCR
jgi:hypothetical protein